MLIGRQQILDRFAQYETARRRDVSEMRSRLERIEDLLVRLVRAVNRDVAMDAASLCNQETMMADLTEIRTEVEETGGVVDSAVALITNLSDRLDDIAEDPAEVRALAEELRASKTELAEAVAANTSPTPEPEA